MLSIKYIPYVRKSSPSCNYEMGKTCFIGYGNAFNMGQAFFLSFAP